MMFATNNLSDIEAELGPSFDPDFLEPSTLAQLQSYFPQEVLDIGGAAYNRNNTVKKAKNVGSVSISKKKITNTFFSRAGSQMDIVQMLDKWERFYKDINTVRDKPSSRMVLRVADELAPRAFAATAFVWPTTTGPRRDWSSSILHLMVLVFMAPIYRKTLLKGGANTVRRTFHAFLSVLCDEDVSDEYLWVDTIEITDLPSEVVLESDNATLIRSRNVAISLDQSTIQTLVRTIERSSIAHIIRRSGKGATGIISPEVNTALTQLIHVCLPLCSLLWLKMTLLTLTLPLSLCFALLCFPFAF